MARPSEEPHRRDEAMIRYYAERAPEYDRIYEKPERQADLTALRERVRGWAADRDVVEVACGTGYWTHELARTARSIVATDAAAEVLDRARAREYDCPVTFKLGNALDPGHVEGNFSVFFAGFLLSHLPRRDVPAFLGSWAVRLGAGAAICLLDNRYVEDSSRPVAFTDEHGDSWQSRTLESGAKHEVRKNFFRREELARFAGSDAVDLEITELTYYWACRYVVGAGKS